MPETKAAPNQNQPNFDVFVWDDKAKDYKPVYTAPDATNAVKGDVLLSDATNSTSDAATGMTAATPKAVRAVADAANNKLDKTTTAAQTVVGPVSFTQQITGSVSGSAAKLRYPRIIAVKNGNATLGAANFDGSANITINLANLDASTLTTGTVPVNRLPADAITKVKGNNERAYRGGNVNLTPENIGALKITKDSRSYYHAEVPSDATEGYLCVPSAGIIPGNASTDGIGHIGTSSWPFREAFIKNVHGQAETVAYGRSNAFLGTATGGTGRGFYLFATYNGNNSANGNIGATILINGYGGFGNVDTGTAIVKMIVRAGNVGMSVYEMAPTDQNNADYPKFGYYRVNGITYFGVILPTYNAGVSILPLETRGMTLTSSFSYSDSDPSGFVQAKRYRNTQEAVSSSTIPRLGDNSVIWVKP